MKQLQDRLDETMKAKTEKERRNSVILAESMGKDLGKEIDSRKF